MKFALLLAGCFPHPGDVGLAGRDSRSDSQEADTSTPGDSDTTPARDTGGPPVDSLDTSDGAGWSGPNLDDPTRSWTGQDLVPRGLGPDLDGDGWPDLIFSELGPDEYEFQPMGVVDSLGRDGETQARNAPYVIDTSALASDSNSTTWSGGDATGDGSPDIVLAVTPYSDPQPGWVEIFAGPVATSGRADPVAEVSGISTGQFFGRDVVTADLDGDAVDEVYVVEGTDSAQNHLYEFDAVTGSTSSSDADDSWSSAASYGSGIHDVNPLGDLTGDGLADLLVAGAGDDGELRKYVISGDPGGRLGEVAKATIEGGENVVMAVAKRPADYNLDGQADVVLVAVYSDRSVVSGFTGPMSGTRLLDDSDWSYTGQDAAMFADAASVGDVDGDGEGDIVLATPWTSNRTSYDGSLALLPGPLTGQALSPSDIQIAGPLQEEGYFGRSLVTVPDEDGDGLDELVVGGYGWAGSYGYMYYDQYVYVPSTLWL